MLIRAVKVVVSLFLVVGIAVSLLSQSILIIIGPLFGGLVLWLLWAGARTSSPNLDAEPAPFSGRH